MAREPLKNVGASVRVRLLHRSRDQRTDFQILLTRYALERLLYRLSRSEHRNRFILKGAMLFVTWVDAPFRPTRDLDLLGYGDNSPEAIGDTFRAILTQPVSDDGVAFDIAGLEATPIREDLEYGGVRVRTQATIAGARIPIQVDVGFGDAITPGPIEIDYPTLLDAPAPHLRAYPIDNGGRREVPCPCDPRYHQQPTEGLLRPVVDRQHVRAGQGAPGRCRPSDVRAARPQEKPTGLSKVYVETWGDHWRTFLTRERMAAAPEQLATVVADLERFVLPLIEEAEGDWRWKPRTGWIQRTARA